MANEFVARKGLIVSGSANITNAVTASYFKGDGSQLTNLPTAQVSATTKIDSFGYTSDGVQTQYNLTTPYHSSSLFVAVDGLSYSYANDYTLSSSILTFVSAPPSSSTIWIRALVNNSSGSTGTFSGSFLGIAQLSSSGHFVPTDNLQYDLGSATNRWRSLYISRSTIYMGNIRLSEKDGALSVKRTRQNAANEGELWQMNS